MRRALHRGPHRRGAHRRGHACDAGAIEIERLTVTHGGDVTGDTSPGDGTCQDVGAVGGACSLRAAVARGERGSAGPQIIDLAAGDVTLTAGGGDLDVTDGLMIDGNGATVTQTVPGERVLETTARATVLEVTLTGGTPAGAGPNTPGGGANQAHTDLTVRDSTITGNAASGEGGGIRTPVFYSGTVVIERTTISGNTTGGFGSGLYVRGGDLQLTNSTVSGNTGSVAVAAEGSGAIVGSTITGNEGSVFLPNGAAVRGSILADPVNGATNCASTAVSGASGGHNLVSDASCDYAATGDQTSTDPLLGALADNGGPTLTHLPDATGPAAGAIPVGAAGLCDGTLGTDQRGVARRRVAGATPVPSRSSTSPRCCPSTTAVTAPTPPPGTSSATTAPAPARCGPPSWRPTRCPAPRPSTSPCPP